MSNIQLLVAEINGEMVAFTGDTEFVIQLSKSRSSKSAFKTVANFKGTEFNTMANHFKVINITNTGFRKRILMNGKLLIKQRG